MKTAILLLVAIFLSNISFAGSSASNCPYKKTGALKARKPTAHNGLLPATKTVLAQKPALGTDTKN